MTKWNIARRAALALTFVALALFFGTTTGLDHTPYFQTYYYSETQKSLTDAIANSAPVFGELYAGFGRASLVPRVGWNKASSGDDHFDALPLAGYGGRRGRPATGVHDLLEAKAVALQVGQNLAVIISADALIIPREVSELTTAELARDPGLRREQIFFGATHTHAGPGGWGSGRVAEAFAGPFQPGVREWMAAQLTTTVRNAISGLKPASLGHGSFRAPAFVRNRLVGALGQVDDEFSYLVVHQLDGLMAVLGAYAAHATVLSDQVLEFSGDYPGYWQRAVERDTGGFALFLAGAMGSHGPVPGGPEFEGAEHMGEALAQQLIERLPQTSLTNHIMHQVLGVHLTLPEPHVRLSAHRRLRPFVARRLLPVVRETFVQGLRLDHAIWISTPCDYSGELAIATKDLLRARGLDGVITSFNGDYVGYVLPARYYYLRSYESRTMSFYGPTLTDHLDDVLQSVARCLAP
jgi:neutral ceramidase